MVECPFSMQTNWSSLSSGLWAKYALQQLCPVAGKSCCKVYYAHNPHDTVTSLVALKGAIPLFFVHSPQQPDVLLASARRLLFMCAKLLLATHNVQGIPHSLVLVHESCAYKVPFATFRAQCRPHVISCPGRSSVLHGRMFDQSHLAPHPGV